MSNVLSFGFGSSPRPDRLRRRPAIADRRTTPTTPPDPDCLRAAGALARACTDWCAILATHPTPKGSAFLLDVKEVIADLLSLGGAAPPDAADRAPPDAEALALRIAALKAEAYALGLAMLAPR